MVSVAEEGVVIEGHFRIERHPGAVAGEDERVDFGEGGIFGHIRLVEVLGDRGEAVHLVGRDTQLKRQLPGLVGMKPEARIGIEFDDLLRRVARHFLNVDTALGARHDQDLAIIAIENHAEVVLGGDRRAFGDEHLVHGMAADVHPENGPRRAFGLFRRLGEFDAARLAATAGVHLGLDGDNGSELSRDIRSLLRGRCHLAGVHRHAVAVENLRRLILMNIHRPPGLPDAETRVISADSPREPGAPTRSPRASNDHRSSIAEARRRGRGSYAKRGRRSRPPCGGTLADRATMLNGSGRSVCR